MDHLSSTDPSTRVSSSLDAIAKPKHPLCSLPQMGICLLWLTLAAGSAVMPQEPVRYDVSLQDARTQMVDIRVTLPIDELTEERASDSLQIFLPTWRPGRYTMLDPVSTLRELTARSGDSRPLAVAKNDRSGWLIELPGDGPRVREVIVSYRIYANSLGDRTRHADDSHAFLSGSSVFVYAPELRDRPAEITIDAPRDWSVATGLEPLGDDPFVLGAADYDVLVDSPIEVGLHDFFSFEAAGATHEYAIWPPGAHYDQERLIADTTRIVEYQTELFGEAPYQRYVFLTHVGAGARGGTEHLNSTIMQTTFEGLEGSVDGTKAYKDFLGLVSHELFHTWNVKQLRPRGITPYDYQSENYSRLFWVSEGTTSYYGDLTLVRTGLLSRKEYLSELGKSIDQFRSRPGARIQSLSDASFDAWIHFARRNPDGVNSQISFYRKGLLVSLLLDEEIRRRSGSRHSLDDVMRALYVSHPLAAGGFDEDDLLAALAHYATPAVDDDDAAPPIEPFVELLASYVDGTDELPLEAALERLGVELYFKPAKKPGASDDDDTDDVDDVGASNDEETGDTEDPDEEPSELELGPFLGAELTDRSGTTIVSSVRADGPAYAAGLLQGDQVIALAGRRLTAKTLEARLRQFQPGNDVEIHVLRQDRLKTLHVVLGEQPLGSWSLRPLEEPTDEQQSALESWLGDRRDAR